MPPARRLAVVPALLALGAAAGAAAPAAGAVTLDPLKPCYVSVGPASRERVIVVGRGFDRNAPVDLEVDGETTTADADAAGVVMAEPSAPYVARGARRFRVRLTQIAPAASPVVAWSRVTTLTVTIAPLQAATSARVRIRGRGFTAAKPIWAHYVFRGRDRRTVRLVARPASSCGTFSVRRRQFPIAHPRPGRWTVQVDQQRRWSPTPHSRFVPVTIRVERAIGAG